MSVRCVYNGKEMTVDDYLANPGVRTFEAKLRKQAAECSNYRDGSCLITGKQCSVLNEGFPTHPQRRCSYFEGILPANERLAADYWNVFQGDRVSRVISKKCARCDVPIEVHSNRQRFCPECSRLSARGRAREGMAKTRLNVNV